MVDAAELGTLLKETAPKIEIWRSQANQLKNLVEAAQIAHTVSDSLLLSIEETTGDIYAEITAYSNVVAEVAKSSPAAASELAVANDALHLVLMEITELGTALYAVRSNLAKPEEALIAGPTP